jgi:ribose transport system permease protein
MKVIGRRILGANSFAAFILMVAFFIINIVVNPDFGNGSYLSLFIGANSPLILVAIGSGMIILSGGIDISLGAAATLLNVTFIKLWETGDFTAFQLVILILFGGILLGAINGFLVSVLRIAPMLATFATNIAFSGLAVWVLPTPSSNIPTGFMSWYMGNLFGIPWPLVIIIIVLLATLLIMKSPFGIWVRATGEDMLKAYVSSINVTAVKFFAYVFGGACAGVASVVITASTGGDARIGLSLSIQAIAVCVIGGISLAGGVGNIIGTVFGSVFLALVTTLVMAAQLPSTAQEFWKGVILLAGVMGSIYFSTKMSKYNALLAEGR